jgi:LysM repeat protein
MKPLTTAPTPLIRGKHLTRATWMTLAWLAGMATGWVALPAQAQTSPQPTRAEPAAQVGVPVSELAVNAPTRYTVKRGDTLWAISGVFLKTPWRWPQLWGMNRAQIRNPHLIYPGQVLVLEQQGGMVRLRTEGSATSTEAAEPIATVKVSPRTRFESLSDSAIPTLQNHLIEPFLSEPLVLDEAALLQAPRIVATQENRVLLSRGDRAYALGSASQALLGENGPQAAREYRVFRDATPLKDPITHEILGYEAQYVGQARLAREQSTKEIIDSEGSVQIQVVPATIDILTAKEEMRTGDRLQPEPPRQMRSYTPHAPDTAIEARVVSVYGSAVRFATQNQVVVINKGTRDGIEVGHVLAVLTAGPQVIDKGGATPTVLQLPDERAGLLMVFRPFERVSYGLLLQVTDSVKVGDKLIPPR